MSKRNGLGDYQAFLPTRVISTEKQELGKSPLMIRGAQNSAQLGAIPISAEQLIAKELKEMPLRMLREFRKIYINPGRDAQWFIKSNNVGTNIAFGASATLISFTVQENFEGATQFLGVNVTPNAGFANVTFTLRYNSTIIHPGLSAVKFPGNNLSTPYKFEAELLPNRLVELIATNTAAAGTVTVAAVLIGYTSYLSDWKTWGHSPASGIG